MAIELAVGYVSILPETSKLESGIKSAMSNAVKNADQVGTDIGKRLSSTASKALKDGWRPDKDIMAGIPDTKLDHIGARIGQVIGKGVVAGLKARQAGREFGSSFADGAGSVGLGKVVSGWRSELAGHSSKLGFLAGKGISAGLQIGLAGATGAIGMALKTGFDRLVALDTAQYKLKAILRTSGRDAKDFDKIYGAIQKTVEGTPFSLDQAFGTAVQAIGAGSQDIERFMKNVSDAAGFAGTDLDRMGLVFTQILAKGKLTGEETMQLMEAGLPARSWIQQSFNLTADQFDKMQQKGEITLDMLQKSIEDHAPGMAKAMGNTLQGSIDNMHTAMAKTGANFLSAVFGGPTGDATEGLKSAVQRVTEMLNQLNAWILAHKDDIRGFFQSAKEAASGLISALGKITETLKEHPGLIQAVVVAFAAFEGIQAIATLTTALTGISTLLRVTLPADAAAGATAMAGSFAPLIAMLKWLPLAIPTRDTWNSADLGLPQFPTDANGNPTPFNSFPGVNGASQREHRGLPPLDPTGGILSNGMGGGRGLKGTPGQGFPMPWGSTAIGGAMAAPAPTGTGAERWRPAVQAALSQYGPKLGIGNTKAWENALVRQIATESGGNPGADNPNDSNGLGGKQHVYGLLQFLPQTFNSHNISGGSYTDPNAQIAAALAYVKSRYGVDANGGPLQIGRGVGYDTGGWLPNGTQLVTNATGQPELVLNPDQQKNLANQGIDPNSLLHGTANGAAPGPDSSGPSAQSTNLDLTQPGQEQPNYGMDFLRSIGFVPASAGNSGKAGTSSLSKFIDMGASVAGGLIDTGTSLAQTAVSAAITAGAAAGTFGAAAPAAPAAAAAAGYGINLLGNLGKTTANYWFGLAGIGADALMEQLSPFGMPRWLGYDYTAFAPQLGIGQAATSTIEKMGGDAIKAAFQPQGQQPGGGTVDPTMTNGMGTASPAGPVQPNQLPGTPPPPAPDPSVTNTAPSGPSATAPPADPWAGLFDSGGMLPPGGVGVNMTSRPEPVLTPQQWEAIASSSSSTPANNAPLVQNLYAQDMQDAIRQLQKVQSRNMLQYSGRS